MSASLYSTLRQLVAPMLAMVCGLHVLAITGCRSGRSGSATQPVTITFVGWGPNSAIELKTSTNLLAEFSRKTGIQVNYITGPESMTDRLPLYLRWLDSKSHTPDVFYADVTWPGVLSEYMLDLKPYLGKEAAQSWPAAIQNDTVDGRLVAMPFDLEIGVLYYRADLLREYKYTHPPKTWTELEQMATRIQAGERAKGKRDFWGFVWQGAPYEGLTCNALEWQASFGGGKIVEDNGVVSVNNPKAIKAMKMAKRWVGTISPPSVLAFLEEDSRNTWDSGNAAFRRDWVWRGTPAGKSASNSVERSANVTLVPGEEGFQASVLGGQSLAVSKYSDHPQEAAELIRYLTSPEVQLELWQQDSMLPALREFYENPSYLASREDLSQMRDQLTGGTVARPSTLAGKHYAEVSRAYFTAVHSILKGEISAEKGMADLESELVRITGFKPGKPSSPLEPAATKP